MMQPEDEIIRLYEDEKTGAVRWVELIDGAGVPKRYQIVVEFEGKDIMAEDDGTEDAD